MRMVVGLGNPGARYVATRHNLGFLVVDTLADPLRPVWSAEEGYRSTIVAVEGQEVALIKPRTSMNASGLAVRKV
ncbi:aminoacyl-tRNA hydrolase, partial [bacterium]|nr:aminoacyl-tRNA hydrolase [bacterium]